MTTATSTRLSIAAHRDFPGILLDGAMPNGESGLLVASGLSRLRRRAHGRRARPQRGAPRVHAERP